MPAQGQTWATKFQIAREVTAGVAVPATRIVYFNPDGTLTRMRAPRPHRFAVGRRDNVLAFTSGPIEASGSIGMPMSADEPLELFQIGIGGGVTPTTPTGATAGRQWVFKPGTLDSASVEWDDGANQWLMPGARVQQIQIQGADNAENTITATLFGTDVKASALTGSLASRVPTFLEGWQTRIYIDAFGSAPGTTPMIGLLKNWQVSLQNNLGRVYTADNTLSANRIVSGMLDVTAQLTVDASAAQAVTEFNNWDAATKRTIRLEFLGPVAEIEAGVNEVQTVSITGSPTTGSVGLLVMGQLTATIAYNAIAATVQAVLNNALSNLGSTYVSTVSGGPWPGTAMVVTFNGAGVAARSIPPITLAVNNLTGGTTPTISVVRTTPGYSGGRSVLVDLPGAWSAVNLSGNADGIRTYQMDFQSVYESTTLAAMLAITCNNARVTAF